MKAKAMRGISPIIATIIIIAITVGVAVVVGGWMFGYTRSQTRMVDIQVIADIVRASNAQQFEVTIKNVGSVTIRLLTVTVTTESVKLNNTLTVTPGGIFTSPTSLAAGTVTSFTAAPPGNGIDIAPGEAVSGYVRVPSPPQLWQSGKTYVVTVTYLDVDSQKTLTKTVTVQA